MPKTFFNKNHLASMMLTRSHILPFQFWGNICRQDIARVACSAAAAGNQSGQGTQACGPVRHCRSQNHR